MLRGMYPHKVLSIHLFSGIESNIKPRNKFSLTFLTWLSLPSPNPLINLSLFQKPHVVFGRVLLSERNTAQVDLSRSYILKIEAAWLKGYYIQLFWDPLWTDIWFPESTVELPQHTIQFVFKQIGFKQGDLKADWLWWGQSKAMTLQAVAKLMFPLRN